MRRIFSLAFVLLSISGCDSCEKKPAPVGAAPSASAASSVATAPADAGAPVAEGTDGGKHDMGNCPTALPGVTVALTDVDGGIEVAVTGPDATSESAIRDRMKKIAEADKNDGANAQRHDHSGSGGGRTGRCTIIMRNTTLAVTDIPKGSKVVVSPKDKTELDWLRRETKERDREAKSAGAAGAGAQRMAHCPSAVDGASTTVKDSKDGVILTVTGPADKVAEIQARAKHSSQVANITDAKDAASARPEHHGDGTGGGSLGRCPIVVEGDTVVAVKDITNGVEVTVTTKKDVATLQKETKLRAANFSAKAVAN